MIKGRLKKHLKLCLKNLKSKRVKCCAACPFEDELVNAVPSLVFLFERKRAMIEEAK